MTGTEIIRQGVELLRSSGFVVKVFNSRRRARTRGWVDVWAARHGVTWLIEVKGAGDSLRQGQRQFADELTAHLGLGLRYVLARSVEDFAAIAAGRR